MVELDALVSPDPEWRYVAELRFTLDQLRAHLAEAEGAGPEPARRAGETARRCAARAVVAELAAARAADPAPGHRVAPRPPHEHGLLVALIIVGILINATRTNVKTSR